MKEVVRLNTIAPIEFVSSGVPELDEITGGLPRGRVTQIYGLSSVGKTSLMIKCMAAISQTCKVLYCDVENAINVTRVGEMGADMAKIDYSSLSGLEEVTELVRANLAKYDVIVLDSIAMLVPQAEHNGEIGEAHVALKPRLLGQWLRIIEGDLAKTKCALVLINQMRKNLVMYGDPYVLPGGMQLKFSSSLMLKLSTTSKDRITAGSQRVGHWVGVEVTKSKVSKPYLKTRFRLMY